MFNRLAISISSTQLNPIPIWTSSSFGNTNLALGKSYLLRCLSAASESIQNAMPQQSAHGAPEYPPGWELLHCPPKTMKIRGSLMGTVVSTKMQKTVNVAVDRFRVHPKYGKRLRFTRKFFAHDEEEVCHLGDTVVIVPDRRRSRHKHFRVHEIIKAKGVL